MPGKVSFLLRDSDSSTANAEIEVEYISDRDSPYYTVFSLLPFNVGYPRPVQLRPIFNTQQEVIDWIRADRKRI